MTVVSAIMNMDEDESDDDKCMFHDNEQINTCITQTTRAAPLKVISKQRLKTVTTQSKRRNDKLHSRLVLMTSPRKNKLKFHDACISTYSSKLHIKRSIIKQKQSDGPAAKRGRRSSSKGFNLKEHCLFCGEACSLVVDPKHPSRWRTAYLCRTSDRKERESYKATLLKICDERQDEWSAQVRVRLNDSRASSDLHAADARYHEDCRKGFTGKRANASSESSKEKVEEAFSNLIITMTSDKSRTWTSTELYEQYVKEGGVILSRKRLIEKIKNKLGSDIIVLWSNGYTSFVVFKCHANIALRIKEVPEEEEGRDDEETLKKVAKMITSEIKENPRTEKVYKRRINVQTAKKDVSPTLSKLLSMLNSKNLSEDSLASLFVGNIITSKVAKQFTQLTLSLAVMVGKKKTVEKLSKFGAVSSYDKLKRFRISAAVAAHRRVKTGPLRHHSNPILGGGR